jgi:hypothetical protein
MRKLELKVKDGAQLAGEAGAASWGRCCLRLACTNGQYVLKDRQENNIACDEVDDTKLLPPKHREESHGKA